METSTAYGKILKIDNDGVLVEMDNEENRLFHDNHEVVFKGLSVGDKVKFDFVIEGGSMTMTVSNNNPPRERMMEVLGTGVGTSRYIEDLKMDSFVIDLEKESSASIAMAISAAKKHDKILIIGSGLEGKTTLLKEVMDSKIKATILIEDIGNSFAQTNKPKQSLLFPDDKDTKVIDRKASKYYYDDKPVIKSGGNNRKVKKRKKAKNGRSGKKRK